MLNDIEKQKLMGLVEHCILQSRNELFQLAESKTLPIELQDKIEKLAALNDAVHNIPGQLLGKYNYSFSSTVDFVKYVIHPKENSEHVWPILFKSDDQIAINMIKQLNLKKQKIQIQILMTLGFFSFIFGNCLYFQKANFGIMTMALATILLTIGIFKLNNFRLYRIIQNLALYKHD